MIAAMMTAANLGARVTGWGFVVFTIGSICWSIVGLWSGQTHLTATNIFLTVVNLVGIWRWLGRQRSYEEGALTATRTSRRADIPSLFAAAAVPGLPVSDLRGEALGHAVDAMIECRSGHISYIVVATGGIAGVEEELRAVAMAEIDCHADGIMILEARAEFERRAVLEPGEWPGRISPAGPPTVGRTARAAFKAKETIDAVAQG